MPDAKAQALVTSFERAGYGHVEPAIEATVTARRRTGGIGGGSGRMWAENNPSGGATFRFTLPAASNES